jgi:hypothetical protein
LAGSYHKLGQVAIGRGDFDLANSLLIKGLVMQQEAGNKQGIAESLAAFAGLALALGDVERAVRLMGATAAYIDKLGAPLAPADRVDLEQAEASARTQIDYLRFDQHWNEGSLLSLQEALELTTQAPTPDP